MDAPSPPSSDVSSESGVECPDCGRTVKRKDNLSIHRRLYCRKGQTVPDVDSGRHLVMSQGGAGPQSPISDSSRLSTSDDDDDVYEPPALPVGLAPEGFEEYQTAFQGRLKTYRLRDAAPETVTIPEFLVSVFEHLVTLVYRILSIVTAVKMNLWLDCEFANIHGQTCRRAFKTRNVAILRSSDVEDVCSDMFQKLLTEKEECEMKGSGWTFVRVLDMEIRVNVYRPLRGSSYIPLPPGIAARKAVVNVLNTADHRCFEYAVLSRYLGDLHRHQPRPTDFTPEVRARARLDFSGLEFPVQLEQIRTFEENNGVSVNVYALERVRRVGTDFYFHIVYPLRVVDQEELYPDHFDLLLLTRADTAHYALITDFNRLVRSQLTRCHGRIHVCKRCFAYFDDRPTRLGIGGAQRLAEHRTYCRDHAPLRVEVPDKTKIRFIHPERSQRVRFTVYADFECALEPYTGRVDPPSTVPPPDWDPATGRGELPHHRHHRDAAFQSSNVETRQVHKPYAYAYYVRDDLRAGREGEDTDPDTFSALRTYRGPHAAAHFMRSLKEDVYRVGDVLYGDRRRLEVRLSAEEEAAFQAATTCHICKGEIRGRDDKVRDHMHAPPYTFRGAAHVLCNLRNKEQDTINVYFHNLSNYDAHFVVRELGLDEGDVRVLANTDERYIAFTKRFMFPGAGRHGCIYVRFLDTYRFLARSLAYLASILPVDKMSCTRAHFADPASFALVRRKGVFPYEYVTSLEVLEEDALPPPEAFHNSLRMEDVTPEDYAHAQHVWDAFGCATLGEYADLYLKTDVLLLTDVFEGFRDMCLQHYGLDPAYWLTVPSYAWDVMLSKTGVELDTLQDVDQYLFFEKGIRGGLAQCVTRHVVADNKYTRSGPDGTPDTERDGDRYIMYYDANNLYGWAMSQPLPYGEFEWLSPEEAESLDVRTVPDDGELGYVLEVDLEYPRDRDLHDRHRDLPFCPEVRSAPSDQLPYPRDVQRRYNVGKSRKLMTTLLDKHAYVIHYRFLKQALENGLRVRRVHRVLRFRQSAWLAPYVALNTGLRQQASNKLEVELFKLMVNAVYGMSLQNVRKHINVKLATNRESYTRYVARSSFSDRTWYSEDLAMLHMAKVRVVLDKPVYMGMCILDHSKFWMYNFHYAMQDRYGLGRIRLAYMDTDSLVYRILTPDAYRDMLEHRDDFDTSNYPRGHICYDGSNARVLGKFKDEAGGVVIKEFIGLMAKLYCFVFHHGCCGAGDDGPPPVKKAKGINRAVVESVLTVDDYRSCLQHRTVRDTENLRFQSRHHNVYTVLVSKRSLVPYDDKRYVVPESNGVDTLPWGHYGIPPAPLQQPSAVERSPRRATRQPPRQSTPSSPQPSTSRAVAATAPVVSPLPRSDLEILADLCRMDGSDSD